MQTMRFFPVAVLLGALAACGGGGADTVAKIEPYVGTWSLCASTDEAMSARITMSLTRTSETAAAVALTNQLHEGRTCTGTPTSPPLSISGKATAAGGKQVQSERVDKIDFQFDSHQSPGPDGTPVSNPAKQARQIFVIRADGRLHYGLGDGPIFDLSNYPDSVDAARAFAKL